MVSISVSPGCGSGISRHCKRSEALLCTLQNITCDVEEIDASYVNTAMDRLVKNDVHYRCFPQAFVYLAIFALFLLLQHELFNMQTGCSPSG